jgi:hypothetical protein
VILHGNLFKEGSKMKNFAIILLATAMVFSFASCDNGSTGSYVFTGDTALNGTWVDENGFESKFNNGSFEMPVAYLGSYDMYGLSQIEAAIMGKGTYTANNGIMTTKTTHIRGETFDLEERWYTRAELVRLFEVTDSLFAESFDRTLSYSTNGDTLAITYDGGYTQILTRE